MKKPNFFIIGAPKCGTTSLAAWLAEHRQIYMSAAKEPHHFNVDDNHIVYKNRDDYEGLFLKADDSHIAVGEASVWYLHSTVAVPNIEQYTQDARYIVCLRNPIEMAYSLHEQQLVNGNEHIKSFSEAWSLNDARLKGESVSGWCREPRHLAYGKACLLGAQLDRLYKYIPRERVHIVLLDDVKKDPRAVYLTVLQFLGVDADGKSNFSVKNPAKERRSMLFRRAVQLLGSAKLSLGIKHSLGILNAIDRKNIKFRVRQPLNDEMRHLLQVYFSEDIALLERLLDRNLSHWLVK